MSKSKKYDQILGATQKLFYRYGIKKVTIEDICKEANVSKMTFYKYFPNKIELAKTMLTNIFDQSERLFRELMESDTPFVEKMERLVQWKLDNSKDASMQFVAEIYETSADSEIALFLKQAIHDRMQGVVKEFVKAQGKGLMRKDLKPELLLAIFDKIQELAGDERVLKAYNNVQEMTREISNFFIYGIASPTPALPQMGRETGATQK